MLLTRREFLKTSAVTAGVAVTGMGFALSPVKAHAAELRKNLEEATQTTTICPYCGCGCGFVVHASGGKVINIEGDSEHPINQGTACSKGSALFQMAGGNNENRLQTVRLPCTECNRVGGSELGVGGGAYRTAGQGNSRRDVRDGQRCRQYGQPHAGDRFVG